MQPEPVPVPLNEKPDLWAMYQRYAHELAPMANILSVNGEIPDPTFDDYWRAEKQWPYWAMLNAERIGFSLIRYAPDERATRMAQFYIVPEHRRGGLGLAFARGLFKHHPGPWRIREMAANTNAVAFWRRVVEPFGYSEAFYTDKSIDRVEQTFTVD